MREVVSEQKTEAELEEIKKLKELFKKVQGLPLLSILFCMEQRG